MGTTTIDRTGAYRWTGQVCETCGADLDGGQNEDLSIGVKISLRDCAESSERCTSVRDPNGADANNHLEKTLRATGLVPPSRAFLAKHTTEMGIEIAERTPPPPKEHHYRKAWVGSTSIYDAKGNELHTWRYAAEADVDPTELANRVAKDVAWILKAHPGIPVHCVQDAAPELDRLPEALSSVLPTTTSVVQLVDFEHLMEYLEDVVDACEPDGDPHDWKGWYRSLLLRDDHAIDTIWRRLS